MSDFFESAFDDATSPGLLERTVAGWRDAVTDRRLRPRLRAFRARTPVVARRILVVGVEVPGRPEDVHRVVAALQRTMHDLQVSIVAMGDRSKFDNVNLALSQAPEPLAAYDWVIVADDDVGLPDGFLDDFIAMSEAAGLDVAQPAHRYASHTSYRVTQRRPGSLVRASRFVEIGPLTALGRRTFDKMIPFPSLRWCWGLDVHWAQLAQAEGWRFGIVDGAPLRHLRPIAKTYDAGAAIAEAKAFFEEHGVVVSRRHILSGDRICLPWK